MTYGRVRPPRPRSRRSCRRRRVSGPGGTSPPGSDSCRCRSRVGANRSSVRCRSRASGSSGACSFSARARLSAGPVSAARRRVSGWRGCWRASPRCWSSWRWPTRRPAPSGPCWSRAACIGLRLWRRKPSTAAKAWGERKEGMAQRSAGRDRDNQAAPPCFEHALRDLDPVRELPCRPVAARCRQVGQMAASGHASRPSTDGARICGSAKRCCNRRTP